MPFRFGKTLFDDELPQAWDLNFLAVRPGPGCAAGPFAPVRERIAVGERRRPVVVLHQIDAELRVERGDELLELHSDVDRPFALWQTQRGVPQRLDPNFVYGPESGEPGLNSNVEPWSTGHSFDQFGIEHFTRPWYAPESQGAPVAYVTDFPGQGPIGRLVYRADDGHVWELFYDHATVGPGVSGWGSAYLTTLAGGAPASATPVAYVTDFPGQGPIVWGDAPYL